MQQMAPLVFRARANVVSLFLFDFFFNKTLYFLSYEIISMYVQPSLQGEISRVKINLYEIINITIDYRYLSEG